MLLRTQLVEGVTFVDMIKIELMGGEVIDLTQRVNTCNLSGPKNFVGTNQSLSAAIVVSDLGMPGIDPG